MREDPHELLGVCRGATEEEIRSAYRNLARQLHPDASGDPETAEAFGAVTTAYEELRGRGRSRAGEGEPVPVRRGSTPRRAAAEPLRSPRRPSPWTFGPEPAAGGEPGRPPERPKRRVEEVAAEPLRGSEPRGEPLRGSEPRGEPLRSPGRGAPRRGAAGLGWATPAGSRQRRRELEPLLWLLGMEDLED